MIRRSVPLLGAVAALALTGLVAGSAAGAGTSSSTPASVSSHVDNGVATLTLSPRADSTGSVPMLQSPTAVTASITGEGKSAQLTPRVAGEGSTALNRTVIIDLDVSGSMGEYVKGKSGPKKIDAAKEAIHSFLEDLPADFKVGLVEFGDKATVTVKPGDRDKVLAQVDALKADSNDTFLYQGVVQSLAALNESRVDSPWIVLLSDGDSFGDDAPESAAIDALKAAEAKSSLNFYPIAFGEKAKADKLLALSRAAGGSSVYDANSVSELNEGFQSAQDAATNTLTFTADVPAGITGAVTFELSATVDGQVYSGSSPTFVETAAAPAPANQAPIIVSPGAGWVNRPVLIAALVALFLAFAAIIAIAGGVFTAGSGGQSEVMRRLSVYTVNPRDPRRVALTEQSTEVVGGSPLKRSAVSLLGRLLRDREMVAGLDAKLDAAGIPLRTAEWMLLHIGVTVGTSFVFLLLGRGQLLAAVVGLIIGFAIPWFVISIRTSRRRSAFLAQLPDTLQALASSLRAGYSLPQAMDAIVQEAGPPISTEFSRSLLETRLGMPAEDALDAIADRTASKDFSWIVMAIRIQRQVGGNLAELLGSVAETLRERERLRGQVRALSAEGRLSAWILGLLPVVFTAYLLVAQPAYLQPMFHTPLGLLLLIGGATLVLLGSLWMRKVVTVEV